MSQKTFEQFKQEITESTSAEKQNDNSVIRTSGIQSSKYGLPWWRAKSRGELRYFPNKQEAEAWIKDRSTTPKKVAESKELQEGGMKAALEDFMESIPKPAVAKIRTIMGDKKTTGVRKLPLIGKILAKHGLDDKLMGEDTAQIVYDYWDTFFGQMEEATAAKPKKAKPLFTNLHHPKGPAVVSKSGKTLKVHKTERAARQHAAGGKK